VLVDGPFDETGVHRQVISTKRLSLTDLKIAIPRCAKEKRIVDAWAAEKVSETWAATSWAKRLAAKKHRASLSDFDRFKVMIAKKQKAKLVSEKLATLA
jgi:large subunit ribosomal protein L14e